ncbi:MAG: hypothetical protein H0V70_12235 [Ktedonobacteraceae bacterium]|nr:hypothetical protein [Ktedonobacteraceae bacterium]
MNISEILLVCGVLIAIVLALFLPMPHLRTKANTPTDRPRTDVVFRDDDRYWSGGFLYNNPDDPAMFVPKRFGIGWTLNFGHPQARLFLITIVVLLLVIVLLPPLLVALLGGGSIHSSGCHTFGC